MTNFVLSVQSQILQLNILITENTDYVMTCAKNNHIYI